MLMIRLVPFLLVGALLWVAQDSRGNGPQAPAQEVGSNPASQITLPVGKWQVEFSNGVKEVCNIGNGGESVVEEPQRRSGGMAEVKGDSVVITFGDDRVERWTPVGKRYVVEHWFPGSRVPIVTPVLGIAERIP
jgi:hypothetical protein